MLEIGLIINKHGKRIANKLRDVTIWAQMPFEVTPGFQYTWDFTLFSKADNLQVVPIWVNEFNSYSATWNLVP